MTLANCAVVGRGGCTVISPSCNWCVRHFIEFNKKSSFSIGKSFCHIYSQCEDIAVQFAILCHVVWVCLELLAFGCAMCDNFVCKQISTVSGKPSSTAIIIRLFSTQSKCFFFVWDNFVEHSNVDDSNRMETESKNLYFSNSEIEK